MPLKLTREAASVRCVVSTMWKATDFGRQRWIFGGISATVPSPGHQQLHQLAESLLACGAGIPESKRQLLGPRYRVCQGYPPEIEAKTWFAGRRKLGPPH